MDIHELGRRWRVEVAAIALSASLAACGGSGDGTEASAPGQGGLEVVCTTGMIGDLARNIGGDRVMVTGLMGPGVDPHYYKATQGDLSLLTGADLILYNGLFLEGKMQEIFGKMARTRGDSAVVAVSRDLPEEGLRQPPEFKGHHDPHIWFDVALWLQTIPTVEAALAAADPAGADYFKGNAQRYRNRLTALDAWVKEQVATVPTEGRVLVTAHDAFGYFGRAYEVEVLGLQGISTVAEYGVNDVRHLVDLVVERHVKAIFIESSVPVRSINAVRQGCLARGHEVTIGGTLYSDAMGAPGSGADTYVGMVEANVKTIVGALR